MSMYKLLLLLLLKVHDDHASAQMRLNLPVHETAPCSRLTQALAWQLQASCGAASATKSVSLLLRRGCNMESHVCY